MMWVRNENRSVYIGSKSLKHDAAVKEELSELVFIPTTKNKRYIIQAHETTED